jgi:low affinity Fe/Cu permease
MQLKLDELLRAVKEARTQLVDLEDAPDDVIDKVKREFDDLKEHVHNEVQVR